MNKKSDNALILFAKRPKKGISKTRIAKDTSPGFAYEFAEMCLIDLLNKINKSDYYDLLVAVDTPEDLLWFQKKFSLEGVIINSKKGSSKAEVQSNKFEEVFLSLVGDKLNKYNYKKAILIPMDIPFICEEDIIAAFARLNKNQKRFVFGPEINGGVYIIGVGNPYEGGLFKKVRWSTSHSFNDLLDNAGRRNAFSLKLKNDLNTAEDIKKTVSDNDYKVLERSPNLIVLSKHFPIIYVLKEKNQEELKQVVRKALAS